MADLSNKCANLKNLVNEIKTEKPIISKNDLLEHFRKTLKIQEELQKYIAKKKGSFSMDIKYFLDENGRPNENVNNWIINQIIAIQDEIQELYEALGGSKYGSAGWKWWKTGHNEFLNSYLKDFLTDEDKEELKFEIVDIYHFVLNIILLGEILSPNEEFKIPNNLSFKSEINEFNLTGKLALKNVKDFNKSFIIISRDLILSTSGLEIMNLGAKLFYELLKLWVSFGLPLIDIVYYYYAKNKENIDRQNRGY